MKAGFNFFLVLYDEMSPLWFRAMIVVECVAVITGITQVFS